MNDMVHYGSHHSGGTAISVPSRARLAVILGIAGGVLSVIGASMPWLSFFAGLQAIDGLSGASGWAIAVLGAVAAGGAVVGLFPGVVIGRWISGLSGFGILAVGGWAGIALLQTANSLANDPLLVSALEPGLFVAMIGGALAFAVLFIPGPGVTLDHVEAANDERLVTPVSLSTLALALALGIAGMVHIILAPEHGRESVVMGIGFAAVGFGQVALAGLVLLRRKIDVLVIAAGVNLVLVAAYVIAVTVGLPVDDHAVSGSLAGHGALGHVEPIDGVGALTASLELVAVGLALRLAHGYFSARTGTADERQDVGVRQTLGQ